MAPKVAAKLMLHPANNVNLTIKHTFFVVKEVGVWGAADQWAGLTVQTRQSR